MNLYVAKTTETRTKEAAIWADSPQAANAIMGKLWMQQDGDTDLDGRITNGVEIVTVPPAERSSTSDYLPVFVQEDNVKGYRAGGDE